MRERTGLFLAKSQWPGVSLRLCVTDIGSEISNWVFILSQTVFRNSSPALQIVLSSCCGGTLSSHLSRATQGQRAWGALKGGDLHMGSSQVISHPSPGQHVAELITTPCLPLVFVLRGFLQPEVEDI